MIEENEEWEDGIVFPPEEYPPSAWQDLKLKVINHPRIALGGGSLLFSFGLDVFLHFDPLWVIVGLGAAITIGCKGNDLVEGAMKHLVPGSDQEQVREDADHFAEMMLPDYPLYADQRPIAKLKRLFRINEDAIWQITDGQDTTTKQIASPQKKIVNQPAAQSALTYERITIWFESGKIDDTQFFKLLSIIMNAPDLSPESESSETVKGPGRPGETGESPGEINQAGEKVSPEEEQAVVRMAFTLQAQNGKVTREEIKAALQWNNKKHWVIKAVCDRYAIAVPHGGGK